MRFIVFLFCVPILLSAQKFPYRKLKEVKIQSNITGISVDRLGGFYTISNCRIEQYDPEGSLTQTFKPTSCHPTELLEAWPLMRIYAYQNFKQQFTIFTNHLEEVDKLDIDPSFAIEPQLAAPSTDLRHYWILDMDNSIKRISLNAHTVDIESDTLKSVSKEFVHIREYQNLLFLLHKSLGIYVVNNLGKLIFKIPAKNTNYFSFAGEDLYYLEGNQIHFYDIFTRDKYSIEVPPGFKYAVATDERLVLIKDSKADIYEFSPRK